MRNLTWLPVAAITLFVAAPAPAAPIIVFECLDAEGAAFFADRCPPGTTQASQKRILGVLREEGTDVQALAEERPVTLYAVPVCDACDLVRNQLQKRQIPFTEKDASSDLEVQNALKAAAGGLTVPAVTIADQVITGYNKQALDGALDTAGYPPAPDAIAPEEAAEEATAQVAVPEQP